MYDANEYTIAFYELGKSAIDPPQKATFFQFYNIPNSVYGGDLEASMHSTAEQLFKGIPLAPEQSPYERWLEKYKIAFDLVRSKSGVNGFILDTEDFSANSKGKTQNVILFWRPRTSKKDLKEFSLDIDDIPCYSALLQLEYKTEVSREEKVRNEQRLQQIYKEELLRGVKNKLEYALILCEKQDVERAVAAAEKYAKKNLSCFTARIITIKEMCFYPNDE